MFDDDARFLAKEEEERERKYLAEIEAMDAKQQEKEEAIEDLLEELERPEYCRGCHYFSEMAESLMDDDCSMTIDQFEYLRIQCVMCHGKTGGKRTEADEASMDKYFQDLLDWVEMMGLKRTCWSCKNVFEVYGKYKDPDDEWKALESICYKCQKFGEDD